MLQQRSPEASGGVMAAAYANVVGGKLRLKGKPLDVRAAGVKKKKKKRDTPQEQLRLLTGQEAEEEAKNSPSEAEAEAETKGEPDDGAAEVGEEEEGAEEEEKHEKQRAAGGGAGVDQRTAAEKRYHEQKAKLEAQRLSKVACTSHRQRVEKFNQYLANLSEHYDIPKVGPG